MTDLLIRYFPEISESQAVLFSRLRLLYSEWNSRINVISRKDFDNFEIHHLLHSLAIARIISFKKGIKILDVGTGGGFPGIPLAIMFPEAEFTLIDSIRKKIVVVAEISSALELKNVIPVCARVEDHKGSYDFIVSRAVTDLSSFVRLTSGKLRHRVSGSLPAGILYLKGGELSEELAPFKGRYREWNIKEFFSEPFFETKKVIYLPA